MAIRSSSLFDVEAPLRRRDSGGWIAGAVPGGVRGFFNFWGDEPTIELAGGLVSILRPARTPFRVGPLPEGVAADGDRLRVSRCSSGELGVALLRHARVVLALGALPSAPDANVRVTDDPRVRDERLSMVAAALNGGDQLVWLDTRDPRLDSALDALQHRSPHRSVVAIAGPDRESRRALNQRAFAMSRAVGGGRYYVHVDERWATRDEWLAHLRTLPASRPNDLHVRITLDGTDHQLREGEYRFSEPWHLYVQRVGRTALEPAEHSLVGIARAHPAVDREALIEAVRTLASAQVGYRA